MSDLPPTVSAVAVVKLFHYRGARRYARREGVPQSGHPLEHLPRVLVLTRDADSDSAKALESLGAELLVTTGPL